MGGVRRLDKLPSWTSRSETIVKEKSNKEKSIKDKEVDEKVSGGAKADAGENAATPEPDAEETEITLATPVLAIPLED